MNPQQSLTCSEHNTYDLVTVVSTAAPLQPKSSGPLSQPAEPVSYNLRSILELGWEGEGLLQLLFSESASDRGLNSDNRSSVQAHLLTPTPTNICFHKSLQRFVWKKSEASSGNRVLRNHPSGQLTEWGSLWASSPPCIGPDKP